MVVLRPYQDTAIADVRHAFNVENYLRVLFVLPTGGGKTVCFSYMASRLAAAGKVVWIIAHRDELLTQISKSLHTFGVDHDVMRGGSRFGWSKVQVCSVQTLVRRMHRVPKPDFIIIDEAHHASARTYQLIIEAFPNVPILGVTATPIRGDGRGMGDHFQKMVIGPTPAWLTENGFLSPYDIYAPEVASMAGIRTSMGDYDKSQVIERMDKPAIYGDVVQHYRDLAYGKRIIVFCVNLKHVEHTLEAYRAAGIPAASLDGNMTPAERAQVNQDFEQHRIWVLVTCEIVNEGYDVPGCDGVQMLRPTQSTGLYLQQAGRALRIADGKDRAIILDHVANWRRHGQPIDERPWTLEVGTRKRKGNGANATVIRMCMECYVIMSIRDTVCPKCGCPVPVEDRMPETKDGVLQKVAGSSPQLTAEERQMLIESAVTLQDWHNVAKRLGYRSGWAYSQYNISRQEAIKKAFQSGNSQTVER